MARLGLNVGLISKVGMDDLGDLLLDELQREGVHMLCKDRAENEMCIRDSGCRRATGRIGRCPSILPGSQQEDGE